MLSRGLPRVQDNDRICGSGVPPRSGPMGIGARRPSHSASQGMSYAYASPFLTMAMKDFASRLAPPTRKPSMSASAISARALSGLTEPP